MSVAAALASDIYSLSALRGVLRDRLLRSAMTDGLRYTRRLEQAYLRIGR